MILLLSFRKETNKVTLVLYKNQTDKFSNIQKDYINIKKYLSIRFCGQDEQLNDNTKEVFKIKQSLDDDEFMSRNSSKENKSKTKLSSILDVFPSYRRTERVGDKLKQGEAIPALGLVSLAILNGPEDIRDSVSAFKQVKAFVKKQKIEPSYNYKNAQHPFSFFRGTLLEDFVTPSKSPFVSLGKFLLKNDKTLFDTDLGKFVAKKMGVKAEIIETGIKNIKYPPKLPTFVPAYKFTSNNYVSEIAARAMMRTTKIGSIALAGIEGAHCYKNINDGKGVKNSLVRSAINLTASIAGIGIFGAIGAKHFGSFGSIAGMGLGSVIGNRISAEVDKR